MPERRDVDDSEGAPPGLTVWQRFLLALPGLRRHRDKAPIGERLREAIVKPVEPGTAAKAKAADKPLTVDELQDAVRHADDKERLLGLLGAPFAAAIGILVIGDLITHDPAALLRNGQVNKAHVSVGLYHELELVLLGLALLMLVTAWWRKRLFLGITMALYGLAIFNLHYWGFGIPYILGAAWLLVRSYRLQRELREANGELPARAGAQGRRRAHPNPARPQPNKRYTPPPPKRSPAPKPESQKADKPEKKHKRAG